MHPQDKYIMVGILLTMWVVFLLIDAAQTTFTPTLIDRTQQTHTAAPQQSSIISHETNDEAEKQAKAIAKTQNSKSNQEGQNIGTNETVTTNTTIDTLQSMYDKTQDIDIGRALLEQLIQQYQFPKATNLLEAMQENHTTPVLNPYLHVYLLLQNDDVKITNTATLQPVLKVVNDYRIDGKLTMDDYRFYQGLAKLRDHNIDDTMILWKQISSPRYLPIITQINKYITNTQQQRDMPIYYRDALIALTLMQNGYMKTAQKLALDVSLEDDDYILPYQILAYSHFLTQNRETAIDYLYTLQELHPTNESLYTFLIGVASYWMEDYEQAVLSLQQVADTNLQSDAQRYLLLSYLAGEDDMKFIQTFQHLLGNNDVTKADFHTYFYHVFFQPRRDKEKFTIYQNNPQFSEIVVSKCTDILPDNDICTYGHAGLAIANDRWTHAEQYLLQLAENYTESYIFEALGDYYQRIKESDKAEQYYLKALQTNEHNDLGIKKRLLDLEK